MGRAYLRKDTINLPHDLLCPLHRSGDQLVRPWAALRSTEQVVSALHVQAGENRGHYAKHALPSLVHAGIISVSPFIRYEQFALFSL